MKKAIILTFLFAVLMVALLVSCNTTPDPLPDETSSEITTDEVTTEEDITTEETTAEAVTLDPNWVNDTTPATYRYLDGLPNEKWYLEWTPKESLLKGVFDDMNREDGDNTVLLKTPLRYEIQDEELGLLLRFEFFETEHPNGSLFQYRVTILNLSEKSIRLELHIANSVWLQPEDPLDINDHIYPHNMNDYAMYLSPDDSEYLNTTREWMSFYLEAGETKVSERWGPVLHLETYQREYSEFKDLFYWFKYSYFEGEELAEETVGEYYIPIEVVEVKYVDP